MRSAGVEELALSSPGILDSKMADDWDKLCLLIDMFPDQNFDTLVSFFQEHEGDIEAVTNAIIGSQSPRNGFDHLVATFPNLEVEAIEAFLVANEPVPDDFSELESLLMVSLNKAVKTKENSLKMNLSEFMKVIDNDRSTSWSTASKKRAAYTGENQFSFSFLLPTDQEEYTKLKHLSCQQVRNMAVQAQSERIGFLKRAADSYKHGNLTGMGSASYYSSQGRSMSSGVERLYRIAAQLTLESFNLNLKVSKRLDLHNLYVNEALQVASEFIQHYERSGDCREVTIITGRGNHSAAGKCRLTPAIWNKLKGEGKTFNFDGIATFSIFFK